MSLVVSNPVGQSVERSWMISVEKSQLHVSKPVLQPVEQTWTIFLVPVVHMFATSRPENTDDVTPLWFPLESREAIRSS